MPLEAGTQLGPYEILSPLGAGGMGEVYKARDTRLDRTVAIKVLLAHVADDPDLRQRFEREAKTISILNHPHICTLHDIGQQDGVDYLVMEYLEGETLAARLTKGPLPTDQVLRYATEIADALDKAHRKGITHRDLKPGNIMITKAGTKLLDFGLAKLRDPKTAGLSVSQRPTQSASLTGEGKILGTLQYMAPEQLEGKEADHRTDIFAFGAVLYEMATGRKAFEGDSQASLIGAILKDEPAPMSTLQPMTPPALDRLVKTCLAKDPEERWQSARDLQRELKWIADAGSQVGVLTQAAAMPQRGGWRRTMPWVAVVVLAATVGGMAVWNLKPSEPRPNSRLSHLQPNDESFTRTAHPLVAVAPDGSAIVYVANNQLFLRPLNALEARPIRGTDGSPTSPCFSPDGQSVGYWDAGDEQLKKIDISGGTPVVLDSATNLRGASWEPDGTILYAKGDGVWTVSAEGGQPELVIPVEQGLAHGPQMLPDGHTVLFTLLSAQTGVSWEGAEIVVHDLESGSREVLLTGEDGRYVPTGHLVYAVDTTLFAVPFDAARRQVTGGPVPIVERVRWEVWVAGNTATANYGFTRDGTLVYVHGPEERFATVPRDLVVVDREGVARPVTDERRDYWRPTISPDGTGVAVEVFDGEARHIWIVNLEAGVSTQLTFEGENAFRPGRLMGNRSFSIPFGKACGGSTGNLWTAAEKQSSLAWPGWRCRPTYPTMGSWCSRWGTKPPNGPFGHSLLTTRTRRSSWRLRRWSTTRCSHPTGTGSPTPRTRRGNRRSTCGRIRWSKAPSGGSQRVEGGGQCGHRTAPSSTIGAQGPSWSHRPHWGRASCRVAPDHSFHVRDSGSPATPRPSTSIPMATDSSW